MSFLRDLLGVVIEEEMKLSPDQIRSIQNEISDLLGVDVEVDMVKQVGSDFVAYYTFFNENEDEIHRSIKFSGKLTGLGVDNFKRVDEAGRVFQVGKCLPPRGAPESPARAFDKPGTNRSVLRQMGKGKWIGIEFDVHADDGIETIIVHMMRDDIEPYVGPHPYYGISVVFKENGESYMLAASGDQVAERQIRRQKNEIFAAAKAALDDPTLPGVYDGLGGKDVKRGKGKLPFDVKDHKLSESIAANPSKLTFKMFLESMSDMSWAEDMAQDAKYNGPVDLKKGRNVPQDDADLMIQRLKLAGHRVRSSGSRTVLSHKSNPKVGMSFDFDSGDGEAEVTFWK